MNLQGTVRVEFDLGYKYSLPCKFFPGLLFVSLLMLLISYPPFVVGGDLLEAPLVVRAQTRILHATLVPERTAYSAESVTPPMHIIYKMFSWEVVVRRT